MSKQLGLWSAGVAILAVGSWMFLAGPGNAGDNKALKDSVQKVIDALKKGDKAGADTQAAAVAKKIDGLDELMELFKKRDKGGWGVGSKPGVAIPDGIELKLVTMGRDVPAAAAVKKEAEALEEMGLVIAAMGTIAKHKPPTKSKKDWSDWCDEMAAGGVKFSEAAKGKGAQELKTAATKLNATCNACHSQYRK